MKPVVVYVKENGEVKLTREELDKLLTDAYENGYADGKAVGTININPPHRYPEWTPTWYQSPIVSTTTCQCGGEHQCHCHSEDHSE